MSFLRFISALKQNVDILTSQPQHRICIIFGMAHEEDSDRARNVIREAVPSRDSTLCIRAIEGFARERASSSVDVDLRSSDA